MSAVPAAEMAYVAEGRAVRAKRDIAQHSETAENDQGNGVGGASLRVAVLGTGKMGAAMAKRLAELGHDLTVWNRTRSRAEALGVGHVAGTPAEAASRADVVISMLTNADAVRSSYLGQDGAVKSAHGQVYVDMSTAGVDVSREIAPAVEGSGAAYVEAPVLGSVGAILAGAAVVLAAGSSEVVDRARAVLEAFGDVRYIGPLGSAAILKLIGNSM